MDPSPSLNVPPRSSSRSFQQSLSSSLMDKFLGLSISPASVQSLSSDTTEGNDLDELDEHEIWGMEINGRPTQDSTITNLRSQASLPPKAASHGGNGSRRPPTPSTPENRSPLGDGTTAWISPTVNSIGSISGMSLASPTPSGSRSPRVLSGEAMARRTPSASRMIPRMMQQQHQNSSQHFESSSAGSNRVLMVPQSAPLKIPDWSKLESRHRRPGSSRTLLDDDVEDDDEERLPPHEFLAREYARSEKTSFSVLEGAGRTLKGRDLSRVRNAVLTCTGFVE